MTDTSPTQRTMPVDTSPPTASDAQTILILGVLGIIIPMVAPVAWYIGKQYIDRCMAHGVSPASEATTGQTIGIVMTIVWGAMLAAFVVMFVLMLLVYVLMILFYVVFFAIVLIAGAAASL